LIGVCRRFNSRGGMDSNSVNTLPSDFDLAGVKASPQLNA
jgi:hypothetical protein